MRRAVHACRAGSEQALLSGCPAQPLCVPLAQPACVLRCGGEPGLGQSVSAAMRAAHAYGHRATAGHAPSTRAPPQRQLPHQTAGSRDTAMLLALSSLSPASSGAVGRQSTRACGGGLAAWRGVFTLVLAEYSGNGVSPATLSSIAAAKVLQGVEMRKSAARPLRLPTDEILCPCRS
jgi:hypothetical protein